MKVRETVAGDLTIKALYAPRQGAFVPVNMLDTAFAKYLEG
ncbi:hypothetical protein FACS1894184_20450 [Clostridia bacterium]|nr:hypothetical protein FACS1894184_20450 [Clostridia bacterium]